MHVFQAGEVVLVEYESGVITGRRITADGADDLNNGENPWYPWRFKRVSRPDGPVHYFGDCGNPAVFHKGIARTLEDATCRVCLLRRAESLRGWRWAVEGNAESVNYLKQELGTAVDGFDQEVVDGGEAAP